ncbi:sigma-70 family RNA polymerase sigma factor [Candidatus Daviesbacteria bacterium]|nr:sigma-70 family RNA polymerase sigma factor [Candidatus Daviesbacteria bacterium]
MARRNPEGFSEIASAAFVTNYEVMLGIAYRLVSNPERVDDLLQNTALRVRHTLDPTRSPRSYLARAIKLQYWDEGRILLREGRYLDPTPLEDLVNLPDQTPSPEQQLLQAERRAILDKLINSLPSKQRRLLELARIGLSQPEIADATHLPLGTVKSRIRSAIQHMSTHPAVRKYLEQTT